MIPENEFQNVIYKRQFFSRPQSINIEEPQESIFMVTAIILITTE